MPRDWTQEKTSFPSSIPNWSLSCCCLTPTALFPSQVGLLCVCRSFPLATHMVPIVNYPVNAVHLLCTQSWARHYKEYTNMGPGLYLQRLYQVGERTYHRKVDLKDNLVLQRYLWMNFAGLVLEILRGLVLKLYLCCAEANAHRFHEILTDGCDSIPSPQKVNNDQERLVGGLAAQ